MTCIVSERNGVYFIGFPPWHNPFGGHQQLLKNRFFSKLPYFHILPRFIFQGILQLIGENKPKIKGMMEIYDTRITIDRLNRILKDNDYSILKKTDYLFNPNYETKFGIKPREQLKIISKIPFFRNFFITASYYLVCANK